METAPFNAEETKIEPVINPEDLAQTADPEHQASPEAASMTDEQTSALGALALSEEEDNARVRRPNAFRRMAESRRAKKALELENRETVLAWRDDFFGPTVKKPHVKYSVTTSSTGTLIARQKDRMESRSQLKKGEITAIEHAKKNQDRKKITVTKTEKSWAKQDKKVAKLRRKAGVKSTQETTAKKPLKIKEAAKAKYFDTRATVSESAQKIAENIAEKKKTPKTNIIDRTKYIYWSERQEREQKALDKAGSEMHRIDRELELVPSQESTDPTTSSMAKLESGRDKSIGKIKRSYRNTNKFRAKLAAAPQEIKDRRNTQRIKLERRASVHKAKAEEYRQKSLEAKENLVQ